MTTWNKLLAVLDQLFGFTNKGSSTVKRLQQKFDNDTQEHVIWLEYRIRVRDAQSPRPDPKVLEQNRDAGNRIVDAILDEITRRHAQGS